MLATLERMAGKIGNLREIIELLQRLWKDDPAQFESVIGESVANWHRYDRVPLALRVILTEKDDARLRQFLLNLPGSGKTDARIWLAFVSALWGDAEGRQIHRDHLRSMLKRSVRSTSLSHFDNLMWGLRRSIMVGESIEEEHLEPLSLRFQRREITHPECSALIDTLLMVGRYGCTALAEKLESSCSGKKASEPDIAACFGLGARGEAKYAPLFMAVYQHFGSKDFWSRGLKRCALVSYAYSTLLGEPLREMLERQLDQDKRRISGWWAGDDRTSEFMAICAILWNSPSPLSQGLVEHLTHIATGAHKENAKFSGALLLLKNIELPAGMRSERTGFALAFAKDFLQYDSLLNFAYYWRSKAKALGSAAISPPG